MSEEATSAPAAPAAKNARPMKPRGWRNIVKGNHSKHPVNICNPAIRQILNRIYDVADSRLYFIQLVAPPALRDENGNTSEICKTIRDEILETIKGAIAKIDGETARLMKVMEEKGIPLGEESGSDTIVCEIKTPLGRQYINCFSQADQFMRALDTLWIECHVDDDERQVLEKRVRSYVYRVANVIDDRFQRIMKEMAKVKTGQASPSEESLPIEPQDAANTENAANDLAA